MARFEALITPVVDGNDLRETLDQIAQQWDGSLTWLDRRNASLDLVSAGLQLKFLLELRRGDDLLLLVTSQEGMGVGAPVPKSDWRSCWLGSQAACPARK